MQLHDASGRPERTACGRKATAPGGARRHLNRLTCIRAPPESLIPRAGAHCRRLPPAARASTFDLRLRGRPERAWVRPNGRAVLKRRASSFDSLLVLPCQ
eukprot:6867836-Alexandrium_andersonii.AAC.1